jgi:hypothetical protein
MTDGLPLTEFVSYEDAKQFAACGQAFSLHPTWRIEEELALAPLIEEWRREVEAAAADGRGYPVPPVEVGMSAATISPRFFRTETICLRLVRLFWTLRFLRPRHSQDKTRNSEMPTSA